MELRALRRPGVRSCRAIGLSAIAPAIVPAEVVEPGSRRRTGQVAAAARRTTPRRRRAHGRRRINDAPALAAADLGIAVAGATDARLTADVVVLGGGLAAVPWLVEHARRVRRVARQNLAWAFGYNAAAVVLAATGALTPLVAALAMLTSSLAVVANARRLGGGHAVPATIPDPALAALEPAMSAGSGAASRANEPDRSPPSRRSRHEPEPPTPAHDGAARRRCRIRARPAEHSEHRVDRLRRVRHRSLVELVRRC